MQNTIIIFSHNRPTYLKLLLRNLNDIFENENYSKFFSSIDIFYTNHLSLPYIKKEKISSVKVNYINAPNSTSSQKINKSFIKYYNEGKFDAGYLLYLDDDCIIDKKRFIDFFKNFNNISTEYTIYSIYNSFSHRVFNFDKKLKLFEKITAGMLGILIPKKIVGDYINFTNISKVNPKTCADSIFIEFYVKYYGKSVLVNPISIIQHIGFLGENNNFAKRCIDFSSSFIYESIDKENYVEILINLFTQRKNSFNFNYVSKIISSIKYKLIKRRVFSKNNIIFK